MSTEKDHLVLEQLRAIRAKLDEHSGEFHTLAQRMTAQEKHMAALIAQLPPVWEDLAALKRRIERIERRLELTP
ncbi:MAG: hypothetical protein ACRDL4_17815 [Thermoleophilaceae bacterium]